MLKSCKMTFIEFPMWQLLLFFFCYFYLILLIDC